MPKSKRANNFEHDRRLLEIARLISLRYPRQKIIEYGMQHYNLSERQVLRYIAEAKKHLINSVDIENLDYMLGTNLMILEHIIQLSASDPNQHSNLLKAINTQLKIADTSLKVGQVKKENLDAANTSLDRYLPPMDLAGFSPTPPKEKK